MTKKAQDIANEAAKMAAEMAYLYTMNKLGQPAEAPGLPELGGMGLAGIARDANCPNIANLIADSDAGRESSPDAIAAGQNEVQMLNDYIFSRPEASPGRNQATWNEFVGVLQGQGILMATTASPKSALTKVASKLEAKLAPKSPMMAVADKLQKHLKK